MLVDPPARRAVEQFRGDRVAGADVPDETQGLADLHQQAAIGGIRPDAELARDVLDPPPGFNLPHPDPQDRPAPAPGPSEARHGKPRTPVTQAPLRTGSPA